MEKFILITVAFILLDLTSKAQTVEKCFKIGTEFSFYPIGQIVAIGPTEWLFNGYPTEERFAWMIITPCLGYSLFVERSLDLENNLFCSAGLTLQKVAARDSREEELPLTFGPPKVANKFSEITFDGYATLGYNVNKYFKPFVLCKAGVSVMQFPKNAVYQFFNIDGSLEEIEIDGAYNAYHFVCGVGTSMEISSRISTNFILTYNSSLKSTTNVNYNAHASINRFVLESLGVSLTLSYSFLSMYQY